MVSISVKHEATLLQYNGTAFAGGTIVKKLTPAYNVRRGVVVEYADNSVGFMEMGQQQGRIDSFTVECFNPLAAAQIQSAVFNEDNKGRFKLKVPNFPINGTSGGMLYVIRFFEAKFQPQSVRRTTTQIYSAQIQNIYVDSESTYS